MRTSPLLALLPLIACSGPAPLYPKVLAPQELKAPAASPGTIAPRNHDERVSMQRLVLAAGDSVAVTVGSCEEIIGVSLGGTATIRQGAPVATVTPARAARLAGPRGLTVDGAGEVLIALVDAESVGCAHRGAFGELDLGAGPIFANQAGMLGEATGPHLGVQLAVEADAAGPAAGSLEFLETNRAVQVPEHEHAESAEAIYIVTGEGRMKLGKDDIRIEAGMFVYIPPGVRHDWALDGDSDLRAVQIYAPSGPEQRFKVAPQEARPPQTPAAANKTTYKFDDALVTGDLVRPDGPGCMPVTHSAWHESNPDRFWTRRLCQPAAVPAIRCALHLANSRGCTCLLSNGQPQRKGEF
jgi:mannose-6-phosphate isomerase-like protein (cupin superfamily)